MEIDIEQNDYFSVFKYWLGKEKVYTKFGKFSVVLTEFTSMFDQDLKNIKIYDMQCKDKKGSWF